MIYAVLAFINDSEQVRLSFVQADSVGTAKDIAEVEYHKQIMKGKEVRLQVYKAECYYQNFEEVSVTIFA